MTSKSVCILALLYISET